MRTSLPIQRGRGRRAGGLELVDMGTQASELPPGGRCNYQKDCKCLGGRGGGVSGFRRGGEVQGRGAGAQFAEYFSTSRWLFRADLMNSRSFGPVAQAKNGLRFPGSLYLAVTSPVAGSTSENKK